MVTYSDDCQTEHVQSFRTCTNSTTCFGGTRHLLISPSVCPEPRTSLLAQALLPAISRTITRLDMKDFQVVHEFIPMSERTDHGLSESTDRIRAELVIPSGAFVVGGAGTLDWRKGYDLFISVAVEVLRTDTRGDVHFVWVGGNSDSSITEQIEFDLQKLGFNSRIHFVGQRTNYLDYLATFDVFA